ncbi:MAG: GTPase [Oscillospiraceae bacterium]|nr:GTPase [Oscillospiraceae bacterium]
MPNQEESFIPVYLFQGFLEAGKTKFIQESMEDPKFATGERTLILVCEEGEVEYDLSRIKQKDVFIHVVEDESELNPEFLSRLTEETGAERVIIEYNGMWQIADLIQNTPDDWMLYQVVTLADASTFLVYNGNMRNLVVDKLDVCELVFFNRVPVGADVEEYHQIVRALNRRCQIYYEFTDGRVMYDDIEDPLPFDVEADEIELADQDFALWFRDMMDEPKKYLNKTMKFKAMAVPNSRLPKNSFALGRKIMTCCIDDTQFYWIAAQTDAAHMPTQNCWVQVTGVIQMKKNYLKHQNVPSIVIQDIKPAEPPEQEIATFY